MFCGMLLPGELLLKLLLALDPALELDLENDRVKVILALHLKVEEGYTNGERRANQRHDHREVLVRHVGH